MSTEGSVGPANAPAVAPTPPTPAERRADADQPDPEAPPSSHRLRWWREVVYIILVYLAYSAVRNQFGSGDGGLGTTEPAFDNARRVIDIQRAIGLYFEADLQEWYLDLPANGLIRVWNIFYGLAHFVVAAGVLIWIFRRFPARYRLWRNTLAFTTLLALIGFATFSLMPPRLLDDPGIYGGCQVYAAGQELSERAGEAPCDEYGYVDTVAAYGGWASFGSEEMEQVSNQFAAMPSMHIGWSLWCAFALAPVTRRRWSRILVTAYPAITLFDIMVTGNHYWFDALGGIACLGIGYLVARNATRWWEARLLLRDSR